MHVDVVAVRAVPQVHLQQRPAGELGVSRLNQEWLNREDAGCRPCC